MGITFPALPAEQASRMVLVAGISTAATVEAVSGGAGPA